MTRSAVAAQLQGHDYQHLLTWYHALRMLDPTAGVVAIEIEAEDAGSFDDLVVRRDGAADEYYQVKLSTDASRPIDNLWLTSAKESGTSPLQKFWASFQRLKAAGGTFSLTLFTNRVLDPRDPLLCLRDSQQQRLTPRAAEAPPGSDAGKRRRAWAQHIGATEPELLEMLSHLQLLTESSAILEQSTSDRMEARGLKHDADAVALGVVVVRAWVKAGVRRVDRDALRAAIDEKRLRCEPAEATLVIQAIDQDPFARSATASVDWVELFEGDEPKARRQLRDPSLWNTRIRDELRATEARIRALGLDRVLVRGALRLSLWFAVGSQLADSRGYSVACIQRGERWTSDVERTACELRIDAETLPGGTDLALALSVTEDISKDVRSYVSTARLPVGRLIHVIVQPEPHINALPDAAKAKSWALKVREIVRDAVRAAPVPRLHLFLSGPAGAALFLGHSWNRVPPTQLYEDLNPGYAPTIAIPA